MNKHGNLQDNRYKVHEVKSLKKMPFPDLARDLLERLVLATQPLMVRQQWRVGQFMEFYPKNGGLLGLNVNAGSRIMIRLRSPQNQQTFLPFESLLGTMVHELVHNAIGEHSFDFYQLVDRLTDEVQRDMHQMRQSGLNPYEVKTAAPFDWNKSQGRKLGSAVAGSAGCGSIQDYLLHGTDNAATTTTAATTRSKPPLTQRPPPPARGSSGSGGSGGGAAVNRPLPTANTTATTATATTTTTTRGSASTSATSADWIRQQRLQALARQGVTDVFTHDRPTRPHRPPIAPATAPPPPPPPPPLPLPAASQPPIVVVDLPWSATLTQPLAAPTTRDTAGANRANKAAASPVTAAITTAATAATVVILDDISGGGTPTSPRLTGTKRAFHPTTLVDGDGYDNVIDLSSSPPLSRTTTARATTTTTATVTAAAASVPPQRQPPQPIDLLDDDDELDTQPALIDEEPDTQPVLLDGAVDDAVDDADAVVWCAPCTPLVIDLIALGLDDDDDDEGDDDGGRDDAFTGPVSSSSAS